MVESLPYWVRAWWYSSPVAAEDQRIVAEVRWLRCGCGRGGVCSDELAPAWSAWSRRSTVAASGKNRFCPVSPEVSADPCHLLNMRMSCAHPASAGLVTSLARKLGAVRIDTREQATGEESAMSAARHTTQAEGSDS